MTTGPRSFYVRIDRSSFGARFANQPSPFIILLLERNVRKFAYVLLRTIKPVAERPRPIASSRINISR